MKARFILPLLLLLAACGPKELQVVQTDPLVKIFPETAIPAPFTDTTQAVRGGHATLQFALRAFSTLEDVTVSFSCEGLETLRCGLVGYVGVEEYATDPAHDALRPVSGQFPDPILTQGPWEVPAGRTTAAWVTVKVPEDAAPGVYTGVFRLSGRHFSRSLPVSIRVWPISLEKPVLQSTNWNFDFPLCMKMWNGGETVEPFSPLHEQYLWDMAAALKEAYQTMTRIPLFGLVDMEKTGEGYRFDFSHFNRVARIYEEAGVLSRLEGGEIGHRSEPVWTSGFSLFLPDGQGGIESHKIDEPCVKEFYSAFLPALVDNLKANGWMDRYCQQVCDEPIDVNADDYRRVVAFVKSIAPEIKVMEALQTTKLTGAVDIWVPQLDTWHNNYDFYRSRQAAGDEVWFYTCCFPRGEYPNRFMEQPLIKGRILYWMAYKYGATGHLHWGFNYWNEQTFRRADLMGTGTILPGGDAWIVYPGYHEFLRSIRFEAMRDGIEDHTLLSMLEKRDPAAARALCGSMVTNWWVYTTSPTDFRVLRRSLLEALSRPE